MAKNVQKRMRRSEVPLEMTWNLTDLFDSREVWCDSLLANHKSFEALTVYQGHLCESGHTLYECLCAYEKATIQLIQLGTYVGLQLSEDATNSIYQEDSLFFDSIETQTETIVSFIESEITAFDTDAYFHLFSESPNLLTFKNHLDEIYMKKPHILSAETEVALASIGE